MAGSPGPSSAQPQGKKRPLSSVSDPRHAKRQRHATHRLCYRQQIPHPLPCQDASAFQMQLLRSISVALKASGFDGTEPMALESFRAATEEYMLTFLSFVRQSMQACRRTQLIPQDFAHALSSKGLTPASLLPHLDISISPTITQPPLLSPPPEEPPPPSLEKLLGPTLIDTEEKSRKPWILPHLPNYPSKHTWQETPIVTSREKDPLEIRERATQEGILAEQALRKLMTASKAGMRARRSMDGRQSGTDWKRDEQIWEETMAAVLQEDEKARAKSSELEIDFGGDGAVPSGNKLVSSLKADNRMMANYERRYWRAGARTTSSLA